MGKQFTRENKNIYQLCREAQGLTREKASELMDGVSASRIEKIEYGTQNPTPYDVIQMADCYKRPDLCNYFCSHQCLIGDRYVPEVEMSELSSIILETVASLNEIDPLTSRLIQIARDGKISDDEMKDFAFISKKLDDISLAVSALNLWVDKTAAENGLNIELLREGKIIIFPSPLSPALIFYPASYPILIFKYAVTDSMLLLFFELPLPPDFEPY